MKKKTVFINDESVANEGPSQPIIKQYSPQKFGNEKHKRDFQPDWFKSYPWLSYSIEEKKHHVMHVNIFLPAIHLI